MNEHAIVALSNPSSGGVALRLADGSHVLAELLGTTVLQPGQVLAGRKDSVGFEDWVDERTGEAVPVFVQAYGVSYEAVREALE